MTARIRNAALWGSAMATALAIAGVVYFEPTWDAHAASTESERQSASSATRLMRRFLFYEPTASL